MKHKAGFNKLSKSANHRKAMLKNMVTSLFRHERINTTKAKAKAVQKIAEKMITRAKVDSVHNRRLIARSIGDNEVLAKLFTEIGPRFKERNGGYTSILKIGQRQGDAAEMVILELVKDEESTKKKTKKKAAPKAEEKKEEKPSVEEKVEEKTAEEAVSEDKVEETEKSAEEAAEGTAVQEEGDREDAEDKPEVSEESAEKEKE